MAALRLSSLAAVAAAGAASSPALSNRAYAESPFRFYPFSPLLLLPNRRRPTPTPNHLRPPTSPEAAVSMRSPWREAQKPSEKSTALPMPNRKQEQTRLAEMTAEKAHFEAIQAQVAIAERSFVKSGSADGVSNGSKEIIKLGNTPDLLKASLRDYNALK
ncbi:AAA-type ATPase family protein [Actinidia rufa]|uniref:AAA-type ATPase family protein n=1 Tax=Actinidia rufa TaxID=165716 RepID=A0A7J0H6L8_9ERIC|nr:AAA-type ATPase family protein [Actinidia rufa]